MEKINQMDRMEELKEWIIQNKPKNIVILSGAGVSTNSGLPTYKSNTSDNPFLITRKAKTYKELISSPDYDKMVKMVENAKPTSSHYLAKFLDDLGLLKRVYTQNIDGLYHKTGLNESKIVEFHGSIRNEDIVLFGGKISDDVLGVVRKDFLNKTLRFQNPDIEMIIVMGSSLKVSPFCALPNIVHKKCCRVLVDINPGRCMFNDYDEVKHSSFVKFGKMTVSLRQKWTNRKRFPNQFIIKSDTNLFSEELMGVISGIKKAV